MTKAESQDHISPKKVLYQIAGMEAVTIRRDEPYRVVGDSGVLTMDLYYPPDFAGGSQMPAIVFVLGFSDVGAVERLGCKMKEMAAYVSWAKLAAASGLVAITYTNREPAVDLQAVLQYVRKNALSLGIDETRIGVCAFSGNVPLALSLLAKEATSHPKCAVLAYGYTMDLDGSAGVAEQARTWGFVNACAGKSIDDLGRDTPLFVVRAGQDQFTHLNEALDRFVAKALTRNLPLTVVNHPDGPHAFDLFHDSETSREIIRMMLAFMRFHLGVSNGPSPDPALDAS